MKDKETLRDDTINFIENTMKLSFKSNDTKTQANWLLKAIEFGVDWQAERSYSENEVKGMLYEVGNAMRFKGINYQYYFNYKDVTIEVNKVLEKNKKQIKS